MPSRKLYRRTLKNEENILIEIHNQVALLFKQQQCHDLLHQLHQLHLIDRIELLYHKHIHNKDEIHLDKQDFKEVILKQDQELMMIYQVVEFLMEKEYLTFLKKFYLH